MNIAEIAIKHRVVTWVLTAFVIVVGIGSYQTMGRLEDPEFTIKQAVKPQPTRARRLNRSNKR